jgi:hypothetical protein
MGHPIGVARFVPRSPSARDRGNPTLMDFTQAAMRLRQGWGTRLVVGLQQEMEGNAYTCWF